MLLIQNYSYISFLGHSVRLAFKRNLTLIFLSPVKNLTREDAYNFKFSELIRFDDVPSQEFIIRDVFIDDLI